mmetsp:Transcript_4386/g.12313  ORF Transcript_4386/g.12313 Transcript_4386/m.12313 type:complete len:181 (+) Transcript_4386:277-819(+)|eukprot:CAMPEP_0117665426 /NCGR_PEP_ID=MMETSP0804-20121206/9802_1 /TAXON_ID=1074897 /ORGANISM="Tetraselmis astigmatica, Strain CCMP880" /LENGTH=180 /DNA_ID=CAMNT_0005472835 /DNA_START=249 /DNA_END=791 /DNA_ORIENTATION=-
MGFCDCCCDPPPPEGATLILGRMELAAAGCCCSAPYVFKSDQMCFPASPKDPRWQQALPGLQPLLAEVNDACKGNMGCCGDPNHFAVKTALDVTWIDRVNQHLAKFGLIAQTYASMRYVANGQYGGYMHPYLQLLVYSLDNPRSKEEMESMARASAEAAAMSGKAPTDEPPKQEMISAAR